MIIDTTIGERGLTERYPELGTGPVSTEPYYSEAHLVHLVEGTYFTHQFWPLSADRTLWEGCTFYEPADNAAECFRQEHVHLLRRESWLEDTRAMESIQEMLKSGAKDEFIFHDHEVLLRHTYKTVMDYVNDNGATNR